MRVASRQDDMHHFRLALQRSYDFGGIEHAIADRVVDLVANNQNPIAALYCAFALEPSDLDHADVFGIGLLSANLYEAAAHLPHNELVAKGLHGIEFAVMPRSFEK